MGSAISLNFGIGFLLRRACTIIGFRGPRSNAILQVSMSLCFSFLISVGLWVKGQFSLFLQISVP